MTSSRAFSSPRRYSSGPGTIVIGDVAGDPGGGHLGQRPGEAVDLGGEAGLEADEGLGGADGEGGDGQALDELVRVVPHEPAVLEGAGLAFGGVAHDVVVGAGPGRHAGPLGAGGESAAAPAPQARGPQLVDRALRAEPLGGPQAVAAAQGQPGIDRVDGPLREQEGHRKSSSSSSSAGREALLEHVVLRGVEGDRPGGHRGRHGPLPGLPHGVGLRHLEPDLRFVLEIEQFGIVVAGRPGLFQGVGLRNGFFFGH